MRIGLHLVRFDFDGGPVAIAPALAAVGAAVEEARFDNLSLMDHYFQIGYTGPPGDPMLEGYTTLGYLAAHTSTVELQLMVTGVTYRHPGLLAKIVSTLDVLSGGRAALGLGAAWYEEEHRGLGIGFPPLRERFERLEETLQVVRRMWSEDDGPFEGAHYRLERTLCAPQPIGRVPIMLGGMGERRTLRLVAQYADACNLFTGAGPEGVARKLVVMRRHCVDVGGDEREIRKTVLWNGLVEPATFVDEVKPYAALGINEVHVMAPQGDPAAFALSLAPVASALHSL